MLAPHGYGHPNVRSVVLLMFQLSRLAASVLCGSALLLGATTAWADGYAGPYLAGRAAAGERDYRAAGTYFHEALSHDPGNAQLQEFALLSDIGRGEFDAALKVAQAMQREGPVSYTHLTLPTKRIV